MRLPKECHARSRRGPSWRVYDEDGINKNLQDDGRFDKEDDVVACMGERKDKDDDMTEDNFQRSGEVRLEGQMTEAMPETGMSVGNDWTRGNHLDNHWITSGMKGSLGYL